MIVPGRISEATRLELGLHQVPHDANLIDLLRVKVCTLLLDKNIQLDKGVRQGLIRHALQLQLHLGSSDKVGVKCPRWLRWRGLLLLLRRELLLLLLLLWRWGHLWSGLLLLLPLLPLLRMRGLSRWGWGWGWGCVYT